MNVNDFEITKGKYLKASDLDGKPKLKVVDSITEEEVGADKDIRPIVYFQNEEQGLVLNKTNLTTFREIYGDETDEWIGKEIVLYPAKDKYAGKIVDCIRVRAKPSNSKPKHVVTRSEPDYELSTTEADFGDDDPPWPEETTDAGSPSARPAAPAREEAGAANSHEMLLAMARKAAERGPDVLKAFFKARTKKEQAQLREIEAELITLYPH